MSIICTLLLIYSATNTHCSKSNPNLCDITLNLVKNMILHEIFRVVSRVPYISCYVCYVHPFHLQHVHCPSYTPAHCQGHIEFF